MHEMQALLNSYFNARSAILRAFIDESFTTAQLKNELHLSNEALNRRRRNMDHWRSNELSLLANLLRLDLNPQQLIQAVNNQLQALVEFDQKKLIKQALITPSRLKTLYNNSNHWQHFELVQLHCALSQAVRTKN